MSFAEPAWLFLLPALAVLAWQWPRLELRRPLRVLCLVLLALALANLRRQIYEPGLDLWVLVDRSESASGLIGPHIDEWEGLLRRSMGGSDRLKFVDFADDAAVRPDTPGAVAEVRTGETRAANALQLAVMRRDPVRATRLLVITDGYPTEPVGEVGGLLARADIPLDLRLVPLGVGGDYQVDSVQARNRVQLGEPFVLDVRLHYDGAGAASVPYQLERDGAIVAKGTADFQNGQARVRLTDRIPRAGSAHYITRIFPADDPVLGNNAGETWVEAVAGPRVLVISAYLDDPVARTLAAQNIAVDLETNPAALHDGRLSGARAVIINNVRADKLEPAFLKALEFFVRDQGGGLLMAGGRNSFGSGGYYGSRLGEVLPVSMDQRVEQRKLAVAMAVVLDRSGSMGAAVPGGGGTRIKMDLADAGAAQAVRLLGPRDIVTVFAVDMEAHPIVPLMDVEPNREEILNRTLRIASQGGGIAVPTGLRAAWAELEQATAGQKHIILFADANDATQETGGMEEIVQKITDAGATLSVIGLGEPTDSGGDFLRKIADLSGGRIFFNADPNELPGIFAQDTVAVARATFVKDPTPLRATAGWAELAARPIEWPPTVDGFNLCYLQPQATAAAMTADDNDAPLVAFWQRGSGRAAAVTFPLAGQFSDTVRAWPGYGDFVTTLTRWMMGTEVPPGLGVKTRLEGDQLVVDLFYDHTWDGDMARNFPQAVYTQNGFEQRQPLVWERLEPGHFQSRARLIPGQPAIGAVQVGPYSLPFGPLAPGAALEWLRDSSGPRALRALAGASGGKEITELSEAWRDIDRDYYRSLRPWLLALLALAIVAEAAATRLGVLTNWRLQSVATGRDARL